MQHEYLEQHRDGTAHQSDRPEDRQRRPHARGRGQPQAESENYLRHHTHQQPAAGARRQQPAREQDADQPHDALTEQDRAERRLGQPHDVTHQRRHIGGERERTGHEDRGRDADNRHRAHAALIRPRLRRLHVNRPGDNRHRRGGHRNRDDIIPRRRVRAGVSGTSRRRMRIPTPLMGALHGWQEPCHQEQRHHSDERHDYKRPAPGQRLPDPRADRQPRDPGQGGTGGVDRHRATDETGFDQVTRVCPHHRPEQAVRCTADRTDGRQHQEVGGGASQDARGGRHREGHEHEGFARHPPGQLRQRDAEEHHREGEHAHQRAHQGLRLAQAAGDQREHTGGQDLDGDDRERPHPQGRHPDIRERDPGIRRSNSGHRGPHVKESGEMTAEAGPAHGSRSRVGALRNHTGDAREHHGGGRPLVYFLDVPSQYDDVPTHRGSARIVQT